METRANRRRRPPRKPKQGRCRSVGLVAAIIIATLAHQARVAGCTADDSPVRLDHHHSLGMQHHHHHPGTGMAESHAADWFPTRIPHILHQVLITKDSHLQAPNRKVARLENATAEWRAQCQAVHAGWEYHMWDDAAAEHLIRTRYPAFLPFWESYDRAILKGDAIRPFILHAYGGLYLDLDTECYRKSDPYLEGYSLVFQVEIGGLDDNVNNGVMASSPGHPFWDVVIAEMIERAPILDRGWGMHHLKEGDWVSNVLWRTGPVLVKETLKAYKMNDTVGFITAYKDSHTHAVRQANQTMAIHVYQVGEFYFPCNWDNPNYCEEVAAMEEKPLEVAGRHHFSASWTK